MLKQQGEAGQKHEKRTRGTKEGNRWATRPAAEVSAWPCCQNNKRSGLGEEELVLLASRPGGKGKKLECLCDGQTEPTERVTKSHGAAGLGRRHADCWGRGGATLATRPTHQFASYESASGKKSKGYEDFPSSNTIKNRARGRHRAAGNQKSGE